MEQSGIVRNTIELHNCHVTIANTEQVGLVENKAKKQRETKVSKKLIENVLQKFIKSQSIISDENES